MFQNMTNYFRVKTIKILLAPNHFYLWAAQLWTLAVAVLCLLDGKSLPHLTAKGIDKYVHITFHFVFALLWFVYFYKKTHRLVQTATGVFLGSFVFGILLEFLQAVATTTRKADALDVAANCLGAIAALSITVSYSYYVKSSR